MKKGLAVLVKNRSPCQTLVLSSSFKGKGAGRRARYPGAGFLSVVLAEGHLGQTIVGRREGPKGRSCF